MILCKSGNETWLGAAIRYGKLEGVSKEPIIADYQANVMCGYTERRAAYLVLAGMGVVDGVE